MYLNLAATAFVDPINPGPTPIIPAGATGPQISRLEEEHIKATCSQKEYLATDKALKQQLLGAFDDMYYCSLQNHHTGYAMVTTPHILDHFYTAYGQLLPQDLAENDGRLKADYNSSQPIESLFDQIEDAVELENATQATYTPAQIITIAFTLVFRTSVFLDACRNWKCRSTNENTWSQFKVDFTIAHQDMR